MSVSKDTFWHAIVYSSATIAGKAIAFLMLPVWAYYIQVEGYGIIGMTDATLGFLMSLMGYGISGSITRFYHEEENERDKKRVISTGVMLIWIIAGSISLLLMVISPIVSGILFGDRSHYKIVCFALAAFFFDLTGQTSGSYLVIQQRSSLFASLGVLRLFIQLSVNIYLIVYLDMGVEGYFLGGLITAFFFSVIFNGIVLKQCGLAVDRLIATKLIGFEWPLLPGNMVSFVSRQIERIMLRYMISLESVGILEMGCKFPSLLPLVITEPFMQSWNTKRTEIAAQPNGPEQIGKVFTYFLFIFVFAGLVLFVNIREIIIVMLPQDFWPSYIIARIEILTSFFLSCYYHLFFGLYYTKNTGKISLIKAVTSLVKIPISFFLILYFGLNGAAYAACVTTCIMMFWAAFLSQRVFPIRIEWRKISAILAFATCLAIFLSNIESGSLGFIQQINTVITPRIIELLDFDFLRTWKSGLVLRKLAESSELLTLIAFKTLVCLSFILALPVVHEGTRERLYKRFGVFIITNRSVE